MKKYYLCVLNSEPSPRIVVTYNDDEEKDLKEEITGQLPSICEFSLIDGSVIASNEITTAVDITKTVEWCLEHKVGFKCRRCGTQCIASPVEGYVCYCPEHDEDMFSFEIVSLADKTVDDRMEAFEKMIIAVYDNDNIKKE